MLRLSGLTPNVTAAPSPMYVCRLQCLLSQTYCISQDKFITQNRQQLLQCMINCAMVEVSQRDRGKFVTVLLKPLINVDKWEL